MIRIQERPRKNILKANISNWTAGHNPVIYKLEREDFKIWNTVNGLGFKVEVIFFEDVSSFVEVGNSIYVKSGIYDTVAEVISIDVTGKRLLTNIQFESTTSGGYVNLKQNYYTLIDVFSWESNQKLTKNSLKFTGDVTGKIMADFSSLLQSFFEYQHDFLFTDVVKDTNNYLGFYIKVEERFKNKNIFDTFQINDISNPTFVSNSSKQLGDLYGQNMGDYLTFPELYPALYTSLVFSNYFDYSSNYDVIISGNDFDFLYLIDPIYGTLKKSISTSNFSFFVDKIFDDYNIIACWGINNLDSTIKLYFISLSDLVENNTINIVETFSEALIGNITFRSGYYYIYPSGTSFYTINLNDYSVLQHETNRNFLSYSEFGNTLAIGCYFPVGGILFIDNQTFTELSFLTLNVSVYSVQYNSKGELFFFDGTNKKIKKIVNNTIIENPYVFDNFFTLQMLFVQDVPDKIFLRDTGKVIAFDSETLEIVSQFESPDIFALGLTSGYKTFNQTLLVRLDGTLGNSYLFLNIYEDKLAKFLTKFDEVPMWKDFPFDLSYIYTEKLERYQTFFRTVYYDKNKMIIDTIDFNISVQNLGAINRLSFNNMPENTCYFEVQVINTGIKSRDYDENDYIETQYN